MTPSIILLITIAGTVGLIFWIADRMGIPGPVNMVIKGVTGLAAIIYLLQHLMKIT